MCEVRSRGKTTKNQKTKSTNGQQQKETDCHQPHQAPNEKMQGIQWTERPTAALVPAGSLWPNMWTLSSTLFWRVQYNGISIS
jgi:hypothetical protein